jgi:hypothetical protein
VDGRKPLVHHKRRKKEWDFELWGGDSEGQNEKSLMQKPEEMCSVLDCWDSFTLEFKLFPHIF